MPSISVPVVAAVAGSAVSAGIGAATKGSQSGSVSSGADQANAALQQGYSQTRGDLLPWIGTGTNALYNTEALSGVQGEQARWNQPVQNTASYLSGIEGDDATQAAMQGFYTSPGYQFRLNEGIRGIESSNAAKGLAQSGATMKAINDYAQGQASSEYQNYYTRANDQFTNYYNRLNDLSNRGQSSAAGMANAATTAATGQANVATGSSGEQAKLTGQLGQGLSTTANSLFNNASVQNALTDWLKSGNSTASTAYDTGTSTLNNQYAGYSGYGSGT